MTPEAILLLERMDERIATIDARTLAIETKLAEKAGAEKVRRRVGEAGRWIVSLLMGGAGVAAGHYWPHTH